jgi:hypothetical protein
MGRFASTASLYEHLRPPYPSEFFRSVAHKLGITKQSSLIETIVSTAQIVKR